jgi:hypothetical protein
LQRSRTYSPYCSAHRKALRRYGSALQRPITLHHLGPHLAAVKGWQRRNADSTAWAILAGRWEALADRARAILAGRDAGHPFNKHGAKASELLLTVAAAATPQEVTVVTLALYLLRAAEPALFPDDRGFLFTLARRVRKLSPLAVGHYWSRKDQRMTAVYKDPPPQVTAVLGQWLAECFGLAGQLLVDHERQRAQRETQERHRLADALGALQ